MYQDVASSLPLQISLYFHGFYSVALVVLTLLIFIYKSALLPYPPSILGFEVTYVFLYGIVEWVRIRQGASGGRRAPRRAKRTHTHTRTRTRTQARTLTARLTAAPLPARPAASKGNKLESAANLLFSLLLAAPVLVFHVYFISLQTYVLRLDQVIQAIALAFVAAECLFSAVALVNFSKAHTV
jgi:hypothetical protein